MIEALISNYDPPLSDFKGYQFSMHAGLPRPRPWCYGVVHRPLSGEQATELGAICHIFRDIDVFSAFSMVAPKRAAREKALKTSIS